MSKNTLPARYNECVKIAMIASAGAGPLGALSSTADAAGIAAIWGSLLVGMVGKSGAAMDKETAKKVVGAVVSGAMGYYGGCKLATRLFTLIPGAGLFIAMGASTVANILFTYRFALVLATLLDAHKISAAEAKGIAPAVLSMMAGGFSSLASIEDIVRIYRS